MWLWKPAGAAITVSNQNLAMKWHSLKEKKHGNAFRCYYLY